VNLAGVYAHAVREAFYASNPVQRRVMVGPVRYRDMWHMRLPFADPELAAKLKSELETSSDAALVGVTGELLVEQLALLSDQDKTPDAVKSGNFGKQLLERARRLDPTTRIGHVRTTRPQLVESFGNAPQPGQVQARSPSRAWSYQHSQ
jgi:hypothetical protein